MTTDNDVTTLFECNTVAEVHELLAKTRQNIEKKKEDLRVMVGERYRDLIEAADTIAEMQGSAKAICGNIQTMEGLCESLQQRGLIGFKTQTPQIASDTLRNSGKLELYSVSVQVKLLVSVPEVLWGLTEKQQLLPAAQLFLLAQHIHTVLQLSSNSAKVFSWFPVIERQWSSISQFRGTIVRGCTNLITSETDDAQAVLDAVVAIMLVEGCDTIEALQRILELRKLALQSSLSAKPSATAKGQVTQFIRLLISSLNLFHEIFSVDADNTSKLEARIKGIVRQEDQIGKLPVPSSSSGDPIELLHESSLTLSFLPRSILQFRPMMSKKMTCLNNTFVKEKVTEWLVTILHDAKVSLQKLLSFTTTIKALAMIRSSIWEVCQTKIETIQWNKVTECLYGGELNPWDDIARDEVTKQAKKVIDNHLISTKQAIHHMVNQLTIDILHNPKICREEGDISGFVWSESIGDLPEQVGWTSATTRTPVQAAGLYYKTRGYTNRIQTICRALNSRLTALLDDLSYYKPGSKPSFGLVNSDEKAEEKSAKEDYNKLLQYLQDESQNTFIQLVSDLEQIAMKQLKCSSSHQTKEEDLWSEERSPSNMNASSIVLVVVARICHALPNVCPQLQSCVSATSLTHPDIARRMSLGVKVDSDPWSKVVGELQRANTRLMGTFLSSLTTQLSSDLKSGIILVLNSGNLSTILSVFPSWENVTIEEEGEEGRVVKSNISIPGHPTPALIQALTRCCSAVNCVAVHTITRAAQGELVLLVCCDIITVYQEILLHLDSLNQTTALQLIFDIKFLQTVLLPRENKELGNRMSSIIQKLESRVDPFDLDVFLPHLAIRVRLAAHRSQVLLGSVLTRDRQLIAGRTPSVSSSGSMTTNNTLPIVPAVEIPRFSNVPLPLSAISHSSSFSTMSNMTMLSHHTTPLESAGLNVSSNKAEGNLSSAKVSKDVSSAAMSASRSAASLFSAMSSSWFGGSTPSQS